LSGRGKLFWVGFGGLLAFSGRGKLFWVNVGVAKSLRIGIDEKNTKFLNSFQLKFLL